MQRTINVAINGFGRIGRQVLRVALRHKNIKIVAVNDLTDTRTLAHLLRYDTAYGTYDKAVGSDAKNLIVDGHSIPVLAEADPGNLPWKKLKVDVVLECTGLFTTKDEAELHLKAGAKRVIISAPAKGGEVPTYVRAVNDDQLDDEGATIINNASCTTNCIAPIMALLEEHFGVEKALMTTVHGYTTDQNLQDGPHKDLRRARAAAANIIPTTTGAALATIDAIPSLQGKFAGLSIRVPVPTVSLADITALVKSKVTKDLLNRTLSEAARAPKYQGVLAVTEEPLVSADFIGDTHSAIVDLSLTNVVGGNLVKIVAWYDNETGYAARLVELAELYAA